LGVKGKEKAGKKKAHIELVRSAESLTWNSPKLPTSNLHWLSFYGMKLSRASFVYSDLKVNLTYTPDIIHSIR